MIGILLASYNGEKYISEQLDSLFRQSVQDFVVVVGDDGSTDGTMGLLKRYAVKFPGRILVVHNTLQQGAKYNFLSLMKTYKFDYVMLCDQDDVWLDTKIERTMQVMKELEAEYGTMTPLLVHTDLRVVDELLHTVTNSFRLMENLRYDHTFLNNQIIQNTLTGCTAMYNRALAELIIQTPNFFIVHDWWLMLIASAFGKIHPLNEVTILYRQHSKNEIGAKDVKSLSYMAKRFIFGSENIKKVLNETYVQAQSFLDMYRNLLSPEQITFLNDYVKIPKYGKIKRVKEMYRLKVKKNGFFRQIGQLIFG